MRTEMRVSTQPLNDSALVCGKASERGQWESNHPSAILGRPDPWQNEGRPGCSELNRCPGRQTAYRPKPGSTDPPLASGLNGRKGRPADRRSAHRLRLRGRLHRWCVGLIGTGPVGAAGRPFRDASASPGASPSGWRAVRRGAAAPGGSRGRRSSQWPTASGTASGASGDGPSG